MLTYEVVSLWYDLLPRWASPPVAPPDGQTGEIGFPLLSWQLCPLPMLKVVIDPDYDKEQCLVSKQKQEEGGNGAGDLVLLTHRSSKLVPTPQRPHLVLTPLSHTHSALSQGLTLQQAGSLAFIRTFIITLVSNVHQERHANFSHNQRSSIS